MAAGGQVFSKKTTMLTAERFDELLADWSPKFTNRRTCAEAARDYVKTAIVPDETRFAAWMGNALAKDQLVHRASVIADADDPLAESHPQQDFDLGAEQLARQIAAGNIHDFRDVMLAPHEHAKICVRCQMGLRSRQVVDERARRAGKKPFPSFGETVQHFEDRDARRNEDSEALHQAFTTFWDSEMAERLKTSA